MITIITAHDELMREVAAVSRPTVERYCDRHKLKFETCEFHDFLRPASWFKIFTLIGHMHEQMNENDFLLWIDTDAVILNQAFDLSGIISDAADIYVARDLNGVNLGVCMWRTCRFTRMILNRIWVMDHCVHHPWWEQNAFMELVEANYGNINSRIAHVPQRIFNAYDYGLYADRFPKGNPDGQFDANSFVVHFPGVSNELRISKMKELV